ncbi:mechanosensitive ion channel family protein [Polaribacter sp.]|jgi:MscS family membrane protein|uniref:mechanosensitive ion channel family protein n=1 Tax=Polaribacter sp. TaxID=1920175 RepID=UPI000713B349|nr:MAG: mechanosensitive ion channel protein MscS [Cryomorphaceae bacterium BACL22 MAG-120619-bin32]
MKKIIFLLFFIPLYAIAQENVRVDLSNPNATIYTHLYFLQDDTYQPKKAAKVFHGLTLTIAVDKAIKLKKILDGKGLFVDFSKIPSDPNFNDTIGYTSVYKYTLFPQRMPEIYVEKINGKWYYSPETIAQIDVIYNKVFPWYVDKLQKIIPDLGNKKAFGFELWQFIGILLMIVISILIVIIVKKFSYWILQAIQEKITNEDSNKEDKLVLKKLAHPISLVIGVKFVDVIFPALQFSLNINTWVFLLLNIAEAVFWVYMFLKLVKVIMHVYIEYTSKTESKLDDQLVPILNNFLTGIVFVYGFFKILTLFGVDATTLLAGATIGGLAFALASQDTVKNLIGTIMIFLDKPFHIGDWIVTSELEGTVEKVGFRSTRVRAADTSIFQIPNSKLSEIVINNRGLLLFRRYNTNLGLRYDTPPELIEAFVQGLRKIIILHPKTSSEMFNVEFVGFGDSALLIMCNVYFKSLVWGDEQSSKHKLHIAIIQLAKELGVDFAFPSTTVTIENFPEKVGINPKYNTNQEFIDGAVSKIITQFEAENPEEEEKDF